MQNYNFIQKFLHDIVLSKKFINKSLFEIEKLIYLKDINIKKNSHIFISGLPRSGTTSLLNYIYSTNQFGSLKYLNMPFVLSPNFSKLFNRKNINKKERLHEDGIEFDLNSPEAFDEVFFKNSSSFIENEFTDYIKLILISENKNRYLSKNNLNYKRINYISSKFPNSFFIIPIREPLQHSYSLLNQHLHFAKLQTNDNFINRYMNYLGHNEFGINHKPWNEPQDYNNLEELNYWLEQWIIFYENILVNYSGKKNCFFLVYEKLSNHDYLDIFLKKIGLEQNHNLNFFKNSNKKEIKIDYCKKNMKKALDLYSRFHAFHLID